MILKKDLSEKYKTTKKEISLDLNFSFLFCFSLFPFSLFRLLFSPSLASCLLKKVTKPNERRNIFVCQLRIYQIKWQKVQHENTTVLKGKKKKEVRLFEYILQRDVISFHAGIKPRNVIEIKVHVSFFSETRTY